MFDFVLLFKHEEGSSEMPTLAGKFPEGVDFDQDEFQYLIPNSIPKKIEKSEVYMFNTESQYYYDYSFKLENYEASIIIVSSHFHPSLFIDFLRSVDSSFDTVYSSTEKDSSASNEINLTKNTDIDTSIYCRFVYVHSLLSSWASNDDGDLVINYPFDSFIIKLSPDLSVYSPKYRMNNQNKSYLESVESNFNDQKLNKEDAIKAEDDAVSALHSWTDVFDVSPLVPHVEAVWATAIQNKGVLVVAQNASIASCSAISILSMLEPMKYAEPCMLFTQIGDPRFTIENLAPNALKISKNDKEQSEIQLTEFIQKDDDQKTKYKIVATTHDSYTKLIESISEKTTLSQSDSIALVNLNFSAIITINATKFNNAGNIKRTYKKKTKRILKKFLAVMNLTLLNDPYFDILEKEVDENQFINIWPNDDVVVASALSLNFQEKSKFYISHSTSIETLNVFDSNINANQNENDNENNENENENEKNKDEKNNTNVYYNENYYNSNSDLPSVAELIQFYRNIQKTRTFKKWRHVREDRDQLRMGFLSVTPKEAVEKVPDKKLDEAYEKVNLLLNVHKKDEHYRIILLKNLSLIKKRIQKLKLI